MQLTKEQFLERIKLIRASMDSPGWALLVQDWQEEVDALKHSLVYDRTSGDAIPYFKKGQLDVLERLLNLGKILDAVESGLDEMPDEDAK